MQCTDAAGDTPWSLLRVNTDTVELVYCEVENTHLRVPLSSLGLSWKSPNCTAKPCPVLLTGRRWLMISPAQKLRATASQHKTCVLQPVLGVALQAALVCSTARASMAVLHSQKCATAYILKSMLNCDLCRFMPVLRNNNNKKDKLPVVYFMQGTLLCLSATSHTRLRKQL